MLPTWVFELVVAPLAAALAFAHARRALGAARAAGELLALAAYGFALEAVAMAVFASHAYDASWRVAPLGVPLAVAAVWAAVITSAMAVAGRCGGSPGWRAGSAALVAIALDLMIEPVATRAGLWSWTPPGPWLGVPIGNFVGWAVIVGAYAYGASGWAGTGSIAMQAARRLVLAAACIAALVAVGLAWTALGLERVFEGGLGWTVWAGVLVAALWPVSWGRIERAEVSNGGNHAPATPLAESPPDPPTGRRTARAEVSSRGGNVGAEPWGLAPPPDPPTGRRAARAALPDQLAATPGGAPEAALCVVAVAFAVEAVGIGEPAVTVAALGSLATLGLLAAGTRGRAAGLG